MTVCAWPLFSVNYNAAAKATQAHTRTHPEGVGYLGSRLCSMSLIMEEMEIQKTIIPLHGSSPHLRKVFKSIHVILPFTLKYSEGKDGLLVHEACCTCRLKSWVNLKSTNQCCIAFVRRYPMHLPAWKYWGDLHFYLILIYSSKVMISKYRVSRIRALFASNKQCKLILLSSVFLIDQRRNLGLSYAIKAMH